MMPNAAKFILSKDQKLATKYPELAEAAKDLSKHHQQFTDTFNSNPQAAIDFAEALLKRNKTKTKNNEMLIHSWNHGLKGTWERYKKQGPDAIKNADYVQRVLSVMPKHFAAKKLNKALTAGYGGAAAPGSRFGGTVLQSESLDDGRKGLKYASCDHCGKEQLYSKFQVKCRECGKHWNFEKLSKLMAGFKR